jgi:hypothetical protein
MKVLLSILVGLCLAAQAEERFRLTQPVEYSGMCDASGGVPVSSNRFVAVSDEDNILRLYATDRPGPALKEYDMNAFLQPGGKSSEADLEGAARIGDRAFWIGSHGRNRDGKERRSRHVLFATDIAVTNNEVALTPVGKPYSRLVEELAADTRFDSFRLAAASLLAPKEPGALNIEGLAATAEGHLLIGFRNPIPGAKALLIPLLNPNEVILGKSGVFGAPVQLELGGLGIRDIAFYLNTYVIIAGPSGGDGPFHLYRWSGPGAVPVPLEVTIPKGFQAEGLLLYPQTGLREFQILSDDGNRLVDGRPGKEIPDPQRRTFRSVWVVPAADSGGGAQ